VKRYGARGWLPRQPGSRRNSYYDQWGALSMQRSVADSEDTIRFGSSWMDPAEEPFELRPLHGTSGLWHVPHRGDRSCYEHCHGFGAVNAAPSFNVLG